MSAGRKKRAKLDCILLPPELLQRFSGNECARIRTNTGELGAKPAKTRASLMDTSGSEPFLEQHRNFCAFDAPPYRVHDAETQIGRRTIKPEPVWQVNFAGQTFCCEIDGSQFKKSPLENDAQYLVAQQLFAAYFRQRWRQVIARAYRNDFCFSRQRCELERIE